MDIVTISIVLILLVLVNAYFAAAEMALVSSNPNKLRTLSESGDDKAQMVLDISKDSSRFLSTIQVGITLAGFFSSGSAAKYITDDLGALISKIDWIDPAIGGTIAFILVTFVLSFLTLIFGELVPKRIALKYPEKISRWTVKPIKTIMVVFKPFVKLLSTSTNLVLKLLRVETKETEDRLTKSEIIALLEASMESGDIEPDEQKMVSAVLDFNDIKASEVMIPRRDVFMVDYKQFNLEVLHKIIDENYSRVPVYLDSIDNIIGIIYTKSILSASKKVGLNQIKLDMIMRKPFFIPGNKMIDDVLKDLQATRNHMACLVDEYGGFLGIVTIEDILEELVGEIDDEYDEKTVKVEKIDEDTYRIDATTTIRELNDYLDLEISEDQPFHTVAGLVLAQLDHMPKLHETIEVGNLVLTVSKLGMTWIDEVILKIKK
ncbi:hemolysin family protein [Acholeplasma vituli]|uniref:Hemolysin family protein n=1 Tax=Paracholeplasma vituli TaxID=69473 RepID=A0ABT2PUI6_9MOLU|nr:hemolysin family protein [Paracholeplasma vituli]MCU0104608.1 hemolysin family protein [Paracholeplasma vituli]